MSNKATRQARTTAQRELREAKQDARWHRSHNRDSSKEGQATRARAIQAADQRAADAQRALNQANRANPQR